MRQWLIAFTIILTSLLPFPAYPLPPEFCFCQATPIWVHTDPPAQHEVALFRRQLDLATSATDVTLAIFADTRYEAYLNGQLIGRGPARFSRQHREYDLLPVGTLSAGSHVLVVRVQWAPNNRRSESERPFLWTLLQSGTRTLTASGSDWQAQLLTAYRSDAAPIHRWNLIGPTELVDLALLPPDWQINGGTGTWRSAVPVSPSPATFAPRSIPQLVDVPVPVDVIGTGRFDPAFIPIEFAGGVEAATVPLTVNRQVVLTFLGLDDALTRQLTVNGQSLSWQPAIGRPPGIVTAQYPLSAGSHILRLNGLQNQPEGWTILISRDGLTNIPPLTFGAHAGRRLLLAPPQPDLHVVSMIGQSWQTVRFQPGGGYLVLDLGRTVHGRLSVGVRGAAGSIIDIGWDERLWQNVIPLPFPGPLHSEWNQVDSWRLDGRSHTITTIDTRAGRYILIAVWSSEPVELHNLQVVEERYPVTQIGSFTSDDPLLNHIWQVGVDSLLPNMTDAYTDTPWRERGQWWGDAYVADHINRVAFGDHALRQRGIRQIGDAFTAEGVPAALAPNPGSNRMLDYGMLWVQSIADDLRLTGDLELALEEWPTIARFLDHLSTYHNPTTGLLDLPVGLWSQTTYLDSSATNARYGQSTAVNAMYYGTLRAAASIATALGETATAERLERTAATLRTQINRYLYDQTTRRYITTIIAGQPVPPGPHVQALALTYEVVPDSEVPAVADALLTLIVRDPTRANLQLYGMFWVLQGLSNAGRIQDALALIKQLYGWQLAQGATTWWEHLFADQYWFASRSHSWSGAPTWFLSTVIVGARQIGTTTWEVIPAWQGVSTASGKIPLSSGFLSVTWEQPDCALRRVTIQAPTGTQGSIWLPPPTASTIVTLNGAEIWSATYRDPIIAQDSNNRLQITISHGGIYTIEQRQTCTNIWLPMIQR
ncbi:MAG TPA: alpha-L-rhamnosidase [Chloroflexus aurantiacus]|uniref:Alpha-L-rhamnosidase n=1 Tax=Chloroflexus aurantiacus (strain ATCC 29366 / DSM 635 / J-10-fl) TaxID=324602 RepID=A9WAG6_CHLAA|nr:family 78 glycoside hydrolase catalytic domain [Chloroflexus aurantiacus]ABY36756.1 alpha-L-rhamnosidase [Chloroflexus aurantiacus J-10-fl]HBW65686.1 alpha-L-rhamnosidase [Chloroflexus aurantiacus]